MRLQALLYKAKEHGFRRDVDRGRSANGAAPRTVSVDIDASDSRYGGWLTS